MLERNFVFLCLLSLMISVLALSCNRKVVPNTGKVKTEEQNSNSSTQKGTTVEIPPTEVIQREVDINLPEPVRLMLRFEKTACYGDCPVYELKFYSDGKAIWHGTNHCERIGYHEAFLPEIWRTQLLDRAKAIRFFSLLDAYPAEGPYLSDLPNTIVYLNDGEQAKSISQNYLTPKKLVGFQEEILKVAAKLNWEEVERK